MIPLVSANLATNGYLDRRHALKASIERALREMNAPGALTTEDGSAVQAPARHRVRDIVELGSKNQVFRIHTPRVVASVANHHPIRHGPTVRQLPRDAVCPETPLYGTTVPTFGNLAVAPEHRPGPEPAMLCFVDFRPEAVDNGYWRAAPPRTLTTAILATSLQRLTLCHR